MVFEEYKKEAKELIEKGFVGEIVFSGGTYEVEIFEDKKAFWVFLEIDDEGNFLDGFCSCKSKENGLCLTASVSKPAVPVCGDPIKRGKLVLF